MRRPRATRGVVTVLTVGVLLAACGGNTHDAAGKSSGGKQRSTTTVAATTTAPGPTTTQIRVTTAAPTTRAATTTTAAAAPTTASRAANDAAIRATVAQFLGGINPATYVVANIRYAASNPDFAAADFQPSTGHEADFQTGYAVLSNPGSGWTVVSGGSADVGCGDVPANILGELQLGCS
jgi:hypothetical protein